MNAASVKELVLALGADKCGIAPQARFASAPEGFRPTDVYPACQSVIVFLRSMPSGIAAAANPAPYSRSAELTNTALDLLGMELSRRLEASDTHAVPVPSDVPYLRWEPERKHGMGILSMRHAGLMAGLGALGKNTLLMSPELGSMVQIGAVLVDAVLAPDPMLAEPLCPKGCRICLDACAVGALDGVTVNQALCRAHSTAKVGRGFDIYVCNCCRTSCPRRSGPRAIA